MIKKRLFTLFVYITLFFNYLVGPLQSLIPASAEGELRTDVAVLVNSTSAYYSDFSHFIQPYLAYLGVPYTQLDLAAASITEDIGSYALIIVGHRQLDLSNALLDSSEEAILAAAVNAGTGLVNFDNELSAGTSGLYEYINTIFGFAYTIPPLLSDIVFVASHYITENHTPSETIPTGSMTLAGLGLPPSVTPLAYAGTGSEPFLAVTNYGQGRAVQWGTYDWMSHAVKGPAYGLDDLVWRSLVWAARKPFVLQGLPPFITMRMDDTAGPLNWIHIANEYGFIPWAGVFTNEIDAAEAADLSYLTNNGKATAAIHAFSSSDFFYFDHYQGQNFNDTQLAGNFAAGTNWFTLNNIPISKYLVGHYYELGSNVFAGLQNWGVEFIGTMMDPGQPEATASWIQNGPFRLYEVGSARDLNRPVYYADFMNISGYPNQFFNCVTEFRDIDNYEWHPGPNVQWSIDSGAAWLKRALNSMELATLFTHEYDLGDINMDQWRQMMAGISQSVVGYNPIYVSLDYACQYLRAIHTSHISGGSYNAANRSLTTALAGTTDLPTKFYVFYESAGMIQQVMVDVPQFAGSTEVVFNIPGALDHITVTPGSVSLVKGATQQFSAQGYDSNENPIPNLPITWSVVNGGGTITSGGLFTAGMSTGTFLNTVVAASGTVQGSATVTVNQAELHHFEFLPIVSPRLVGIPFPVTIRAVDVNNNLVVDYSGQAVLSVNTGTIQPTLTGNFTNGVWTGNVTLDQVASGVTITANDNGISGTSAAFDVAQMRECPCSIWDLTATPVELNVSDGRPIEVGVKFRSDIDGYLTGLRFYKGNLNIGTHTGHLWDSNGNLLATATFTGETSSGWQQANFSNPVAITANTTYVASYYSPSGFFSFSENYFFFPVVNVPLKALANGEDGLNGVYRYDSPGFPTLSWVGHAPNYWVDVVFDIEAGPDTTPPLVSVMAPTNGATGINVYTNITASFNESLDPASVNSTTFELRDSANNLVAATVTYSVLENKAILDPVEVLAYSAQYTARLVGGTNGIKDLAGNPLAGDVTWSFTTSAPPPPPPDEGPGGPILVISAAANPFGRYFTEILRAEGLNAFYALDISTVNASVLQEYQVVILGEMALTAAQVTMLTDWVNAGGNLIAMRPDSQLAGLLGLSGPAGTLANAYLLVNTSQAPGSGIVADTIQYHGVADLYTLNGATSLATLYSNATTPTANPAVTLRSVGVNGGQAAAFTYDLARSVVYTRQGNPAWAGQERDGISPIRPDDLFYGNASGDPQPDWVDLNKVAIPQADEQQRLLANLIGYMDLDRMPLPRFWYLPRGEKAAVVMTGDDHAVGEDPINSLSDERFDQYAAASPLGCSVDDWECVRATAYIYPGNTMTDQQAAYYNAQGFEIGLHVNTGCADFTLQSLTTIYATQLAQFVDKYPSLPAQTTERTHCIAWSDWASQVKVKILNNIRLDTNYYFWPPSWVLNRPGLFTGSGFPMRFADQDGTMFDVYQAVTQMTDESGQTYPFTINTLLDRALGSQGYYGVFTANMHHDYLNHSGADAIVATALARSVPVISARQLLTWLDGRNSSSFEDLTWNVNTLNFRVNIGAGANGLQVLLPVQSQVGPLTGITLDGTPIAYQTEIIKGVEYALFQAGVGTYQAAYNIDLVPPVISNVDAIPGPNGSAVITWQTNEPADSRVVYGVDPINLDQSVTDPSLVTSHAIPLSGLLPSTQYFYRVVSADYTGNTATWPPVGNSPLSFITPALSLMDTTKADFSAGTYDGNIYITEIEDGEVRLAPALAEEFTGSSLPAGWVSSPWTGGISTVTGGKLIVDGALATTVGYYTPGRAIEFYGTFGGQPYQHMGLGQTLGDFNEAWAIFSTMYTSDTLFARTNNFGTAVDTLIPGNWVGSPHRYRIEWTTSTVKFLIDGNLVHTQNVSLTANMRPVFSDYSVLDQTLQVDWLWISPYPTAGMFTSRVLEDGDQQDIWKNMTWTSEVPAGTSLSFMIRTGNTPVPDDTWSAFTPVAHSGDPINITSRYIQYQVQFSTTNPDLTPVLKDVTFFYGPRVNHAPVAVDDAYATSEDIALSASAPGVLGNDDDPEHDPISAILVSSVAHGALNLNPDGSFTYTPAANWNGTDGFTYKASDSDLDSNVATVTIQVAPMNDAPVAEADEYYVSEDTPLTVTTPGVLGNDTDLDSDPLTAVKVTDPGNGALTLNANGSFTYTPAANWNGTDSFTYKASDGTVESNVVTVTIHVAPVNDPPVAMGDSYITADNQALEIAAPGVLVNDSDIDSVILSAILDLSPAHGTLTLNADGSFTYTPETGYVGTDSFTYHASDGALGSNIVTVSLQVIKNAIFADGFESGDLRYWSASVTDGGDLSVTSAAAMVGSWGMQAMINDTVPIYVVDETPLAEKRYRVRFYFDPNTITMASGDAFGLFSSYMGVGTFVTTVEFRYTTSGGYQLRAGTQLDNNVWSYTSWVGVPDRGQYVEFDWKASSAANANDGYLTFWIDGVQKSNLTGLDTDTRQVDRSRLGAVFAIDAGTQGTIFFDAFRSTRITYMGMEGIIADFSATPIEGTPPLMVTFTNLTMPVDSSNTFSWDFGDGTTSTEANPIHIYTNYGSYTVSLTVTGLRGSDSETKTDYIRISDLIFADGFESGTLNAWSSSVTDGGDLSVMSEAALIGAYGMQVVLDDNTPIFVTDESPNAEKRYRVRFYFDPNSIPMASGDAHILLIGYSNTGSLVISVEFRYTSTGGYQLRVGTQLDKNIWSYTSWFGIADQGHYVEADWKAASAAGANNGFLTFWIDGVQKANLINLDTDTRQVDRVRLGAVSAIDNGTRGTYYFDAFRSTRNYYNGPEEIIANFSATPTQGVPPLTVTFTNLTQPLDPGTTFLWDFGDGITSNVENPVHTYTLFGVYTVSLTVTGPRGTDIETKVNFIQMPDVIFSNGFEEGNLTKWSSSVTDGGDLSVTGGSRLVGTYGLQAVVNDNKAIYVIDETPNAEKHYRARFYFDPNSIAMANRDAHSIFIGYMGTGTYVISVELRWISYGDYQLRFGTQLDNKAWQYTTWYALDDNPNYIEFDWQAASAVGANDGYMFTWLNGYQMETLTGLDTDTRQVDMIRLGAVAGIDSSTRGTYFFDEFKSTRSSYIGP